MKRRPPHPVDLLLLRINEEVADLPRLQLRDLAPHFAEPEQELAAALVTFLGVREPDDLFTHADLGRALRELRSTFVAFEAVRPALRLALVHGRGGAEQLAVRHLTIETSALQRRFAPLSLPLPTLEAGVIAQGKRTLLERYARISKTYTDETRAVIRRQLAIGVLRRETVRQMTRRIEGPVARGMARVRWSPELRAQGLAKKMTGSAFYRAERIVRTEVLNAYNIVARAGIIDMAKEDPELKQYWCAALDGRTCPICVTLDGKVVNVGAEFLPGVRVPQDLHPQCRCALLAWRESWQHKPMSGFETELPFAA